MSTQDLNLPWVPELLYPIQVEYSLPPPTWRELVPTKDEYQSVLQRGLEPDAFDTLQLKKQAIEALQAGKAKLYKCVSDLGVIHLVSYNKYPTKRQWNLWWRCVRLICPEGKVNILLLGHPRQRELPDLLTPIDKEHVNAGMTMRCDPKSIVVYRREELTRVLIHELFHASCSDPYHLSTPLIEADTEAWTELVLCAIAAKGNPNAWVRCVKQQIEYAAQQAGYLYNVYNVKSPKDYAWRYITGRLDVWKRLGIHVPIYIHYTKPIRSLRFTIIEPDNN